MSPVRDLSRTRTRLNAGGSAQHLRILSRTSQDRWRIWFEATALAVKDYCRMKDEPEPEPGQNQNGNFDKAIFHELSVRRAVQAKRNLALKEKERKEFAELDQRARLEFPESRAGINIDDVPAPVIPVTPIANIIWAVSSSSLFQV